ncbi:recombinase RecT [Lactobacillus sp. CC-MHH1034]|uniref:recombinase RecT n=1 Tax=Agrilactobacillus fermenti TaxID=2586909 RepID=UPI001E59CFE0|nr:recombinase RecT [Agrilactobacillus fermenti]MCD2257400.1 recombinase RecT [Agrilactobacillus fermenti]
MATSKSLTEQLNQHPAKVNAASLGVKALLETPTMKRKFETVLKDKANGFITSVLNLVSNDTYLAQSNGMSIVTSAMVAATLDLPIDKNLGYAWIVPFKDKNHNYQQYAQFQLGYKGYIQLALRTGQYKHINAVTVYQGEIKNWDRFTETYERGERTSDEVVGYLGYFEMVNGFKKTVYWTKEQIEAHRIKFNKGKDKKALTGVWRDNYDAMAIKTVIRNMLSKWGILSIEMQKATVADENTATDFDDEGNPVTDITEEATETIEQTESESNKPKTGTKKSTKKDVTPDSQKPDPETQDLLDGFNAK